MQEGERIMLNNQVRKSGISIAGDIAWGTHISHIYSSKEDFNEVLAPYMQTGLLNNELCAWIYSPNTSKQEIINILSKFVPDISECISNGQLKLIPYTEWYVKNNCFDGERVTNQWLELIRHAKNNGYEGLRAIGDTFWLSNYSKEFAAYEKNINLLIPELPFIVICSYDINHIDITEFSDIINNHSLNILKINDELQIIRNKETSLHVKNAELQSAGKRIEIKQKEKLLLEILDSSTEGTFIIDFQKNTAVFSEQWAESMGLASLPPDKILQKIYERILPEDLQEFVRNLKNAAAQSHLKFKSELSIMDKSNKLVWVLVQCKLIYNCEGELSRGYGSLIDITGRKLYESQINRQNTVLQAINHIYEKAMSSGTVEKLIRDCLAIVETVTESEISYIGEIGKEGFLHGISAGQTPNKIKIQSLCENVIKNGKTILTNISAAYPDYPAPQNPPALTAFLGVPFFNNNQVAGIIAVANRKGGYSEESRELLESLVPSILEVLLRKRAEEELANNKKREEMLAGLTSCLLASENPQEIMEEICGKAMDHIGCDMFFNYLVDRERGCLHLNAFAGIPKEEAKKLEWLEFGAAVCGCAARDGRRIVAECIPDTPDARTESLSAFGVLAYACHPLMAGNRVIGTLGFGSRTHRSFKTDDLDFMKTISGYIAIAMGHLISNNELKQSEIRATKYVRELRILKDNLTEEVNALKRLHLISSHYMHKTNIQNLYCEILEAAVSLTRSDKGNMQLFDQKDGCLKIIVHQGFGAPFLRHFEKVTPGCAACGKAMKERKRVIVYDIQKSTSFSEIDKKIFLSENIRCVQSTPMFSGSGAFLGVLSTHYKEKHLFSGRELWMIDLLARQAADVIERLRIEDVLQQSEKRALELVEELKKADHNKNEFLSTLSHELRNPLAAIVAGISLMDISDDKLQIQNAKEIIKRQINQLCHLVDDLLELTRIIRNKIELKKEKVELLRLASKAAEDFKILFNEKGVALETHLPGGTLYLDADPVRITQAIGNLLQNALKFTDEGGKTILAVSEEKGRAVISVEDDGIGIKTEFLPNLFEPFMQANNSLERTSGGIGLGLSIVKGIAELHGGSVNVKSGGQGRGTKFYISLPVSNVPAEAESWQQPALAALRPLRILLIEDNRDFTEIMCSLLTQMGHDVAAVGSGVKGIEKAKSFEPDIIFCDIGLPGLNGFEVAKVLKSDAALKKVPIVALTGYAGYRDHALARDSGFDFHVAKPVNTDMLKKILSQVQ